MRVKFSPPPVVASGGATGLALPATNEPYLTGAIRHELGHVLDAWLLNYDRRLVFRQRYCDQNHGWGTTSKTENTDAVGEAFANTYAWAFHGAGQPGYGHHWFPMEDRDWFVSWLLGMAVA